MVLPGSVPNLKQGNVNRRWKVTVAPFIVTSVVLLIQKAANTELIACPRNQSNFLFILQRRVLKLYKDFFNATKLIQNKAYRKEVQDWIRVEFKNKQHEKNLDAIKLFIHQGERSLKEFVKTIHISK